MQFYFHPEHTSYYISHLEIIKNFLLQSDTMTKGFHKKTSKRVPLKRRYKIEKRVKQHNKKLKKQARKQKQEKKAHREAKQIALNAEKHGATGGKKQSTANVKIN